MGGTSGGIRAGRERLRWGGGGRGGVQVGERGRRGGRMSGECLEIGTSFHTHPPECGTWKETACRAGRAPPPLAPHLPANVWNLEVDSMPCRPWPNSWNRVL